MGIKPTHQSFWKHICFRWWGWCEKRNRQFRTNWPTTRKDNCSWCFPYFAWIGCTIRLFTNGCPCYLKYCLYKKENSIIIFVLHIPLQSMVLSKEFVSHCLFDFNWTLWIKFVKLFGLTFTHLWTISSFTIKEKLHQFSSQIGFLSSI